ncbi:MAG: tetratricopeptide repeat protein [Bacteroidales bacterium]|nr:tetratricopeptide repeat protein [Bacteroidales bacterium]
MIILAIIGFTIAWVYYGTINRSADPRVKPAQIMYGRYNVYIAENNPTKVLELLDSIQDVYLAIAHYRNSYEMGVVLNNRASVFLTLALNDTVNEERRQLHFLLAKKYLEQSIDYYTGWIDKFGNKDAGEVFDIVHDSFTNDSLLKNNKYLDAIINNRVKEIASAQAETPRRLSVSYANMGIIHRHQNQLDEAVSYYVKALDLWSENLAAKNNLNVLLGEPIEKQSFFRKLFPPDKN